MIRVLTQIKTDLARGQCVEMYLINADVKRRRIYRITSVSTAGAALASEVRTRLGLSPSRTDLLPPLGEQHFALVNGAHGPLGLAALVQEDGLENVAPSGALLIIG